MSRRIPLISVLGMLLVITIGCTNKKSVNPLAGVGSKQPDKVLFDKAMDAMRHNRFDVARLTLQTLINTYPDSEFIARAKLAVGDSWYAEAEQEYADFEIFFPNMPEAAEAQLKIANIHYQQMEKADRDFTHAKRAEDEYRKVLETNPGIATGWIELFDLLRRQGRLNHALDAADQVRLSEDGRAKAVGQQEGCKTRVMHFHSWPIAQR